MKNIISLSVLSLFLFTTINCTSSTAEETAPINSKYEIASDEYEALAQKALDHVGEFQFAEFYDMLADDVEYYFPDGGPETRTKFIGKDAVMGFWDSYVETSGNTKINTADFVHLPVNVKERLNYSGLTGVMVISYVTLEMFFDEESTSIRSNWGWHFNADKKIDRIYTYYDRTPIIAAAQRNILSKQE